MAAVACEMPAVTIDGLNLTLRQIEAVACRGARVGLDEGAAKRIERSRRALEQLLGDDPVYGVNTGFGRLATKRVPRRDRLPLQRNLVRSHASGAGRRLATDEVRAIMLLRANALARGRSGCREVVVRQLVDMLNHRVHPAVPELGSVSASGDLAPLAHIALAMIGEGVVEAGGDGGRVEAADAKRVLRRNGITPLVLAEKEGLALINGTQAVTGIGALVLLRYQRCLDAADVAGAISLEGLKGSPDAFRAEIHAARPHDGQVASARRLWELLEDSEIRESHRTDDPTVQDPYSLRCMPQVHGAARAACAYARDILTTEANSATDNPLVFPESGEVISGGNFHAQIVAQCLDLVAIAAADVAAICERRVDRMLNPDLSGLPAFLTPDPGLCSGMMIAQVVAADALAEMRVLAAPASIHSVSTSASQEDHVAMGMAAARKVRRSVSLLETVLAVELMCGAQAVEFHRPLRAGRGVEAAIAAVRQRVSPLVRDRPLGDDIEALTNLVREGL